MNDSHILDYLNDYIDGTLSDKQKELVETHIQLCPHCAEELRQLQLVIKRVQTLPSAIHPPENLLEGIESRLHTTENNLLELRHRNNGVHIQNEQKRFSFSLIYRIAAGFIVLLAAGVVWYLLQDSKPEQPQQTENERVQQSEQNITESKRVQTENQANEQSASSSTTAGDSQSQQKKKLTANVSADSSLTKMITAEPNDTVKTIVVHQAETTVTQTQKSITGRITGKVVDEQGNPLVGTTVVLVGTTRGAVTDSHGNYTIIGIPSGTYSLRISNIGYASLEITDVKVESNQSISLMTSTLQSSALEMKEVTVTANRPIIKSQSSSSYKSVTRKMDNIPTVGDAGQLQSGVVKQGNNLFLRSGRSNEGQYVVDGVPVEVLTNSVRSAEQYDLITENIFHNALSSPLSTFSIDVDNASYSNIRRFLNDGQLPPKDAVRIEEMINYFKYDYPQPKGSRPFSINAEVSECPWNNDNKLLLIGLQGKIIETEELPPSNLVFLIDVSGSMSSPDKLPLVQSAFRLLVKQLRKNDRVSIVVYAGSAGLVLPSTKGNRKDDILEAIDRLHAGGSTAGGAGIALAYNTALENYIEDGNNRVILATDGDFNVGVSDDAELVRMIEEKRNKGVFLSVLGFGTGNLKDSKMEKLADKGNGNYSYIDNIDEARKVFVQQLTGTLYTIAKDVKIQIEFNPAKVKSYRLIGYENRLLRKEDFHDDTKDAGELGSGHTVTALYEIVPEDDEDVQLLDVDTLRYQKNKVKKFAEETNELLTIKLRYKEPDASASQLMQFPLRDVTLDFDETSDNFRWAAAVAEFGMLLRNSKFKGDASFRHVVRLANGAKGEDLEGYRSEFIKLVEKASELK
ncbi:MAG: von Willebrand factor type A domain-containing protein [Ignavibacteriae bacterium]|nr:von Willebrand factor type A domain-containing protein [Ignavibacteriota bacterium]